MGLPGRIVATVIGMRIDFVQGDITAQRVDVIVNSTDAAIHLLAGDAVREELRAGGFPDDLPVGRPVVTGAGPLDARWLVHVVGPVHGRAEDGPALMTACFQEVLRVTEELGAGVVAFPALWTGASGWPVEQEARIAVHVLLRRETSLRRVRFVLPDERTRAAFESAHERWDLPDEDIEHELRAVPPQRWQELFTAADALTTEDRHVGKGGGTRLRPGVYEAGYPIYSEPIKHVLRLLPTARFRWTDWVGDTPLFPEGRGLDQAPVVDAVRLATALVRGERFSDGLLGRAIRSGALDAIIARLRRWHDER